MIPLQTFYYIRHGETFHNLEQKCSGGDVDAKLTPRGKEQAIIARNIVESLSVRPSCIIHTGLSRTFDTARIINENMALPVYKVTKLKEMKLGQWENKPFKDTVHKMNNGIDPLGGETHKEFRKRIIEGFQEALNLADAPVLIIAHGRLFRNIPAIYGLAQGSSSDNCSVHKFKPLEKEDMNPFPWNIYRYELCGSKTNKIQILKKS